MITLIIGGARSGKSTLAEKIANKRGGKEVIYLATAEVRDDEMKERVAKHRLQRPTTWKTIEEPYRVSKRLEVIDKGKVLLLDCLTVLITNLLLQGSEAGTEEIDFTPSGQEEELMEEIKAIVKVSQEKELDLIIVTNEVGQGLVPPYKLGRLYRDVVGRANQYLASIADKVYLCVAGLPIEIKEIGMKNLDKFS